MEQDSGTTSGKFSIKVDSRELDRIVQARKNLDDVKALALYAAHYMDMGWSPRALETHHGTDLGVNFHMPQADWLWLLMDLALQEIRVELAIYLEPASRLFVLRVNPELGKSLDRLGNWRSPCVARLGDVWEHHFLRLPQAWEVPSESIIGSKEAPLSIIGPRQLVTVPPSLDLARQESWHWLAPPWEQPPQQPCPELLMLLEDCGFISKRSLTIVEDLPSWKEIYPLICHSEGLLQALLAPEENSGRYLGKILHEALQAGFRDLRFLQGLLWHAPHSEMRQDPEGRQQLAEWTEQIRGRLAQDTFAGGAGSLDAPEGAGTSLTPEHLMKELRVLETQTLELERQLDKLEDLRSSSETGPGGSPPAQEELKKLSELRQAVEEFLADIDKLPDIE